MVLKNKDAKKGKFYMRLNSLQQNPDDPSLLDALFVIHDFEPSWSGQVITEEVATENMQFLVNKPIVCKYIPKNQNDGIDAITDHEEFIDQDRNTGEDFIATDTVAIGVFTEVYVDDFTDTQGVAKRVLYGRAVLWFDKCRNVCLLIDEWLTNDILVPASVEYMYYNYSMIDGIEYIQSPLVYLAHALLNAEDRGNYAQVFPNYDSARLVSINMKDEWNKAVAQISASDDNGGEDDDRQQLNSTKHHGKEGQNNMEVFKKMCEISHGALKSKIYEVLSKTMVADEYDRMWISDYDVYDEYFIYESWTGDEYEYYKVAYTKSDETDEVTVDYEGKAKVERTVQWETMANQLAEQVATNEELQTSLNAKDEDIADLTASKKDLTEQFNDATETLTSLNAKLEQLKEIETQYNNDKFEKALNTRKAEFELKFKGVGAAEKFETDEVQNLIKESINSDDALVSLNSMLVELIPNKEDKKADKNTIKDFNTKEVKNLIPKDNSFESRYFQ